MTVNSKLILLNRVLNAIMWLAGVVAAASAAGQVPKALEPYAAILSIVGGIAAKFAKTPSAAIAAAVPPAQIAQGVPVPPEPLPAWKDPPTGPTGAGRR